MTLKPNLLKKSPPFPPASLKIQTGTKKVYSKKLEKIAFSLVNKLPINFAMSTMRVEAKVIQHLKSMWRSSSLGCDARGKSSRPEVRVFGFNSLTALALRPRHL
jgi:hypothetical protein